MAKTLQVALTVAVMAAAAVVAAPLRSAPTAVRAGDVAGDAGLLRAPPLAGRATATGIDLNVLAGDLALTANLLLAVEVGGTPLGVRFETPVDFTEPVAHVRLRGVPGATATEATSISIAARSTVLLELRDLPVGTAFAWQLGFAEVAAGRSSKALRQGVARGRFTTSRPRGTPFTFAVFSDTHAFPQRIEPEIPAEAMAEPGFLDGVMDSLLWYRTARERVAAEYTAVFAQMNSERFDFAVSLGDVFDLHGRAFNWAFTSQELADTAHLEARRAVALLFDCGALYQALGNWEGESGCHPDAQRSFARRARQRHAVNPRPDTSPWGGSVDEDYFAFEWGDLLAIVLNVRGYTKTAHHMDPSEPSSGRPDDFTLGAAQKKFLEQTLARAEHPHKALFLHHVVGGNGGNPYDSSYGRGGGRAAAVGEQAWVHDLCRRHGAKTIFYGHDHVFTDLEVDGIHYALPGTTSAPWRFSAEETGYEKFWTESGYARVSVAPERMQVEFVSFGGPVLHSFSVTPGGR